MSQRLIYVMGPSGAGKDSVLDWLRLHLPQSLAVHWARRTITRPAGAGERHEPVTEADFDALNAAGAFALAWRANGLRYGVRHGELSALGGQGWVFLNGSRGHFAEALARFPGACGLHITAPGALLRQRLLTRGRESAAEVEQRVARAAAFEAPPGVVEVRNEGSVEQAGKLLLQALHERAGWPGGAPETAC